MSMIARLGGVLFASIGALALGTAAVDAQEQFPSKPVTLIVPWAAGGGSDVSMRLLAEAAQERLGQPIVVVNRPGAGGAEGTREIATAEPDGYTFGMVGSGLIARHYSNPNANDYNELQPIVFFGNDPSALSVRADTGITNVEEFVERAKAEPGSITNGNDQPGGASHIAAAVIESKLDIQLTKVPYEGFAPTVVALVAGEVQSATVPVPDVLEHHKSGAVRIIGVTDTERHFLAPDVPTFQEQGFDVVIGSWRLLVGPRGMPEERLAVLEQALLETLNDPEFVERANAAGFGISPMDHEESAGYLKEYDDLLYPILKEAGLVRTRARD